MKKRLQAIYWRGILITLVMALAAIGTAAKLTFDDTRSHLTAMLETAVKWTRDSDEGLQALSENIAGIMPGLRATFMLDTGLVLADSTWDPDPARKNEATEDPGNDREIAAARRGETGRALRLSPGDDAFMLYMARRVSPQLLLRLSYPLFQTARVLAAYGAALLFLFLVLYFIQRRGIARFAADQNRQFEDIRRLLDGEIEEVNAVFPELQPSLDAISYRVKRLREDHQEILRTMNLRADFVANASHELRSPLTSVRGFAEMLEEGLADTPEEQALCVRTIRSECDRMLAVIEDILRLGKAERDQAAPAGPLDVLPIAQEVAKALQPQAGKKRIRLEVSGQATVQAEEKNLWEILYNLADNAIRYGKQGGSIMIRLDRNRLTVRDDGIGIAPDHLPHIFEPFYRVDDARDAAGGTGLGLSIVKAIVERLGGSIRAESTPGVGTDFIIDFPAEDQAT